MSELVLSDANFEAEVKKANSVVLVDFWAPWCGPCQMMGPVVEDLTKKYEGKAKIGKLNVDENPQTSQTFGVMSIPTLIIFKNGEEKERLVGAHELEALSEKIDKHLS